MVVLQFTRNSDVVVGGGECALPTLPSCPPAGCNLCSLYSEFSRNDTLEFTRLDPKNLKAPPTSLSGGFGGSQLPCEKSHHPQLPRREVRPAPSGPSQRSPGSRSRRMGSPGVCRLQDQERWRSESGPQSCPGGRRARSTGVPGQEEAGSRLQQHCVLRL